MRPTKTAYPNPFRGLNQEQRYQKWLHGNRWELSVFLDNQELMGFVARFDAENPVPQATKKRKSTSVDKSVYQSDTINKE